MLYVFRNKTEVCYREIQKYKTYTHYSVERVMRNSKNEIVGYEPLYCESLTNIQYEELSKKQGGYVK